jgi:multidrug efflux pump subunit AcrA (membrane-fusion protein)
MSISINRRFNWSKISRGIQHSASFLIVIAIAIFGFWGGHLLLPGTEHSESSHDTEDVEVEESRDQVVLTAEKVVAADIEVGPVVAQPFQHHQSVPGTIIYDSTRKVELRAMVDCVVKQTLIQPAQYVERGQPLVILSGPDVGAARNKVSQCKSNYELVRKEYEWTLDTHTNVQKLLQLLQQSPPIEEIKSLFDQKNLGEHRDEILTAYSEFGLAKRLTERTSRLETQGVIPGKTADQRRSQYEIANARFDSLVEEMKFQTKQGLTKAAADLAAA